MRGALPIALVALLGACDGTTLHGRLVDPLHGGVPHVGEIVLAKAVGSVPLTCQTLSATTDDDGRFAIPGLCMRQTAYRLEPSNDALLFSGAETVQDAGDEIDIQAWWAPAHEGGFILRDRDFVAVSSQTDLRAVHLGDQAVLYPTTLPDQPPVVAPSDHLVFRSSGPMAPLLFEPVLPSGPRTFGETAMEPWSYLGVRFADDTTFERVATNPDPERVQVAEDGEGSVRYVAGDALPAGRYAVFPEGSRRAAIVEFGQPPPAPSGP